MNQHLFPVKLFSMLKLIMESEAFEKNTRTQTLHLPMPSYPEDNKARLVLCTPEIHSAVSSMDEFKNYSDKVSLRKRLAVPKNVDLLTVANEAKFEVYEGDDYKGNKSKLVFSKPVTELKGYVSAAVEIELFRIILQSKGVNLNML